MRCGGISQARPADDAAHEVARKIRADLEAARDGPFSHYEVLEVATQVVAGINYFLKILVNPQTRECLHVRVFQDLQQHTSIAGVQESKKDSDALEYF
jgi:hypothetical protein